jgi:hypothetical protein
MRVFNKETGKFFTLADSLKSVADFLDERYLIKADTKTEDGTWITIKGNRILLNEEGVVIGGAGGSMNGMKLDKPKPVEKKSLSEIKVPTYEQILPASHTPIDFDHTQGIWQDTIHYKEAKVLKNKMNQWNSQKSNNEWKREVNQNLRNELKDNKDWQDWNELRFMFSDDLKNYSTLSEKKARKDDVSTATFVSAWASSSGDHRGLSCSVQHIAQELYGIPEEDIEWGGVSLGRVESIKDALFHQCHYNATGMNSTFEIPYTTEHEKVYVAGVKAMLTAQYNITQEFLKTNGIKELSLYRGIKDYDDYPDNYYEQTLAKCYQPLSSFAPDLSTAFNFGNKILQVKAPASQIQSLFTTGYGCANEYEVVLINNFLTETVMRKK